jgi:hypothetical protein
MDDKLLPSELPSVFFKHPNRRKKYLPSSTARKLDENTRYKYTNATRPRSKNENELNFLPWESSNYSRTCIVIHLVMRQTRPLLRHATVPN